MAFEPSLGTGETIGTGMGTALGATLPMVLANKYGPIQKLLARAGGKGLAAMIGLGGGVGAYGGEKAGELADDLTRYLRIKSDFKRGIDENLTPSAIMDALGSYL